MFARLTDVVLFFEIDGYGWQRTGNALVQKPTLAVLHGGPGFDHSDWVPWLAPLAEHARLIYVDHRGNGRSSYVPPDKCTPEAMADDLEQLRQYLGLDRWFVLGGSFGGMVALNYAIRHPSALAGLILSATAASYRFVDEARVLVRERGTTEQVAAANTILDGAVRDETHLGEVWPTARPLYYYNYQPEFDSTGAATIRSVEQLSWFFAHGVRDYDVAQQLGRIRAPTLVLTGQHDFICPPSQSAELVEGIPNARQVIFERSGHLPHKEQHAEYLDVVRQFILVQSTAE